MGLNFAITPKTIPKENIVQEIEPVVYNFPEDSASNIRIEITDILRHAKLPRSNLNRNNIMPFTHFVKINQFTS